MFIPKKILVIATKEIPLGKGFVIPKDIPTHVFETPEIEMMIHKGELQELEEEKKGKR